jgi:hypothetical protein
MRSSSPPFVLHAVPISYASFPNICIWVSRVSLNVWGELTNGGLVFRQFSNSLHFTTWTEVPTWVSSVLRISWCLLLRRADTFAATSRLPFLPSNKLSQTDE